MKDTKGGELFEQNQKLTSYVLKPILANLPSWYKTMHYDDLNQVAKLGLWKAAKKYNPDGSASFSTFAIPCIRNEILMYLRKNKVEYTEVSFETPVTDTLTIADVLEYTPPIDVSWIFTDRRLNDKQKLICKLIYQGYTQSEIAEKIGVCQVTICRYITKIGQILKKGEEKL
jgi:RNA polymerase sigma factor (sigma-70 family)